MNTQELKMIVDAMESKRLGYPVVMDEDTFKSSLENLKKLGFIEEYHPVDPIPFSRVFDLIKEGGYTPAVVVEEIKSNTSRDAGECFLLSDGLVIIDNGESDSDRETWIETMSMFNLRFKANGINT